VVHDEARSHEEEASDPPSALPNPDDDTVLAEDRPPAKPETPRDSE
jgi:hypothetical protein